MARRSKERHFSGRMVGMGITLLGFSGVLLLLSIVLGSASPLLKPVGGGLRLPLPYLVPLGLLLTLAGWALRPRPAGTQLRAREPDWLPKDSTDFARSTVAEPAPSTIERRVRTGRRPPADRWCAQVFEDIEWRRFETLCGRLFAQAGFEPRMQSHGADGGVDIWLHSRHAEGPVAVVQCKHWHGKQVGVKEVREFFGVMASRKVARGTYATTSTFTDDARVFAKENGIHLLDGDGLLALIGRRTPEQQQDLLAHAYEGEYWRPTCASCGSKMVERTPRKGGKPFWGCAGYPKCRSTLPMRNVT